ncbi:uncharacterized protein DNG_06107 [Cephalotrichum gorgonifer]|uniref:Uncharacterized protein n=1 Tax=Cephalotrichum gorgonifer TaxID=2041049 RepID=A0AAE8N0V4_9PEZI|nr:uncharacterized protein DNG_06107 [Cephalotrichum gorgonifer]
MTAQVARSTTDLPPSYPAHELTTFSSPPAAAPSLPRSSTSDLPPYEEDEGPATNPGDDLYPNYAVPTPFRPTQTLRIDCLGHGALRLPCPPRTDPVCVYDVTGGSAEGYAPLYASLRDSRSSGTCRLVRGDGAVEGNWEGAEVLCTTTYRFGPGRPPVITLCSGASGKPPRKLQPAGSSSSSDAGETDDDVDEADADDAEGDEGFTLRSVGTFTRSQVLRTHLGTLRWRYASSKERKGQGQDSILILEKITSVSKAYPSTSTFSPSSSSRSKTEEVATEVARFVRGPGTRTPGTSRSTAGNGGVLLMDLSGWRAEKGTEEEEARVLVVSSCISMLKKEVDRRRAAQIAITISVISGA